MTVPRLRMQGVKKRFGATQALRGVSLEVSHGEVHALIGENGAGKSTLMKILSGACRADEGKILLEGNPFKPSDPLHARRCGIAMIYQELTLVPDLTVEENILLGVEPRRFGWVNQRRSHQLAFNALAELNQEHIPLNAPIKSISIAQQQLVEIARALLGSPKVLIMDEPTSSLTQIDTENLFRVIDRLRERGVSIIYISHFLEECQRIANRFTVLRDGETVGSGCMNSAQIEDIIRMMVGREVNDIYPRLPHSFGKVIFELSELRGAQKPSSVSLALREGEILGIAGLVGAGRTETLRACFGLDSVKGGNILVENQPATHSSPPKRLQQKIGLLSENRKDEGLLLNHTIAENLTLTHLKPFSLAGFIRRHQQIKATGNWMRELAVRARDPHQSIRELSGGNQQKIALARLLHHEAKVLLLDEPTRGIDVASKAQIYRLIAHLAAQGKAIIFVSSYLPELLGICDTIGVMCRGVLTKVLPVSDWTEHSIISAAIGQPHTQPN